MATRQEIKAPKPFMLIGLVLLFSAIALAAVGLTMNIRIMLYVAGADFILGVVFLLIGARRDSETSA